jgi:hypothetical protein
LLHAEGQHEKALAAAHEALAAREDLGAGSEPFREGFVAAASSAMALGDTAAAENLLEMIDHLPRGKVPQYLHAHAARLRAQLAAQRANEAGAEAGFKRASSTFRELGIPFWIGVTLLEYGEWLVSQGRDGEAMALISEAREIFERLEATPWLERVDALGDRALAPSRA